MKKGFWRTFESVLAVIILILFLLAIGAKYKFPLPELDLSKTGYEMLKDLDSKGELRSYVVNNQYDVLNSKINIENYNHSIQICNMANECYGEEPDARNVWVSTYIISGENTYDPREVRLFIW